MARAAGRAKLNRKEGLLMMVEQIYRRKSVRKFKNVPIPREAAQALITWREWVHPLRDRLTIDNHIRRLPGDAHIKGLFVANAPAYMLYTSQQAPLARVNAGFILEQISLGLYMYEVGSCYQGGARFAPEHLRALRFDPMMIMAYGVPAEPLTRELSAFKRRNIEQICQSDLTPDMRRIIDAARLAPSAMNRQPWRFVVRGNDVHCYVAHSAISHVRALSEIDLGIALSHMYLVVTEGGGKTAFTHRAPGIELAPRGADYIITMSIN